MLTKKKVLLEMSENELEAVIKVIFPGRSLRKHTKLDLQEEGIHWLLNNGLRLSHEFILIELGDGSYGVLTHKNKCSCCQRSVLSKFHKVSMLPSILGIEKILASQFGIEIYSVEGENHRMAGVVKITSTTNEMERSVVAEEQIKFEDNLKPSAISTATIIGEQPLPRSLSVGDNTTKADEGSRKTDREGNNKQQKGGLSLCCTELGTCCISLLGNC
uniref:DUF4283 domain-containing protein n=1 Tax=Setaria digitata TaxID=48799 RepID=A0A915PBG7_9BILA